MKMIKKSFNSFVPITSSFKNEQELILLEFCFEQKKRKNEKQYKTSVALAPLHTSVKIGISVTENT